MTIWHCSHPSSKVTLAFPILPAALVAIQKMVPKWYCVVTVTVIVALFVLFDWSIMEEFSWIQVYNITSGLVLITLQCSVTEPPIATCVREAFTSTTGATNNQVNQAEITTLSTSLQLVLIAAIIMTAYLQQWEVDTCMHVWHCNCHVDSTSVLIHTMCMWVWNLSEPLRNGCWLCTNNLFVWYDSHSWHR